MAANNEALRQRGQPLLRKPTPYLAEPTSEVDTRARRTPLLAHEAQHRACSIRDAPRLASEPSGFQRA
jgi:hypothetical protein